MWTQFMDMHSGGGLKENFQYCYIEAPEEEAKLIFYNRFGHDPERITCTCCGDDYSIMEFETLQEATAYERKCASGWFYKDTGEFATFDATYDKVVWDHVKRIRTYNEREVTQHYMEEVDPVYAKKYGTVYISLEEYLKDDGVMFIFDKSIKPEERLGEIHRSGYVWQD
jgi:hypothetical protein